MATCLWSRDERLVAGMEGVVHRVSHCYDGELAWRLAALRQDTTTTVSRAVFTADAMLSTTRWRRGRSRTSLPRSRDPPGRPSPRWIIAAKPAALACLHHQHPPEKFRPFSPPDRPTKTDLFRCRARRRPGRLLRQAMRSTEGRSRVGMFLLRGPGDDGILFWQ